jgi:hypothetical protein
MIHVKVKTRATQKVNVRSVLLEGNMQWLSFERLQLVDHFL